MTRDLARKLEEKMEELGINLQNANEEIEPLDPQIIL